MQSTNINTDQELNRLSNNINQNSYFENDTIERREHLDYVLYMTKKLNSDATPENHWYNSLTLFEKIKKLKLPNGTDTRPYGKIYLYKLIGYCIPLAYVGKRPVISLGRDWYFQLVTLGLMIFCYFTSYKEMFIYYKYPILSYLWFFALRVTHFVTFFCTSMLNPGFASKSSLEEFKQDFKINVKDEEELHW